jgi:hypothetical protein
MKILFYILSVLALTTSCSILPSSCPTETDLVTSILVTKDSIIFPENYKLLEKASVQGNKQGCYNGCFKLSHADISEFVKLNKLKADTSTSSVFRPCGIVLLKTVPRGLLSMPVLRKNHTEIYADTIADKIYVSEYY